MTHLIDAGPMIALIDKRDADHVRCAEMLSLLPDGPLVTTWPCLAEAFHILGKSSGWSGQLGLWNLVADDTIMAMAQEWSELWRCRNLMQQYADLPMDFADASLVALAEKRLLQTIFTLDHHFGIYRPRHCDHFDVVP